MLKDTSKIKNDGEIEVEEFKEMLGLDSNEATLQLASPKLVQYYNDKSDRIIWLDKYVDDTLFEEIKLILYWNKEDAKNNIAPEDRKPIKLMIHSYGGDLDACFAMLDVMNISKTPIYTYNMNACMSAGALIYLNGHKRYAMPLSTVLIHQGQGGAGGQYEQVLAQTENYKKMISMIKENVLAHTKISKAVLTKNFNKEWYIYIEDQVKYGITDEIIKDMNLITN